MNKLTLISDIHLGKPQPPKRNDDFLATQWNKFVQVIDIAEDNGGILLQGGDLFDSVNPPKEIISDMIRLLRKKRVKIYTVLGQHDCYMHALKLIRRTPSYLLESAGVAKVVVKPVLLKNYNVKLYGWSFGQGSYLGKPDINDWNIMLTHQPIGDKSPSIHYSIISAKSFLMKYKKFDLILCGDFHYPYIFSDKFKNKREWRRYIVNTGCLVRKDIMKRELERDIHVQVLDIKNRELTKKVLDFEPSANILDIEIQGDSTKLVNQSLTELIKKLDVDSDAKKIGFKELLMDWFKTQGTVPNVKNYIGDAVTFCEGEL